MPGPLPRTAGPAPRPARATLAPQPELILPRAEILDAAEIAAKIDALALAADSPMVLRRGIVSCLQGHRAAAAARLDAAILERPWEFGAAVHAYACLTDGIVRTVHAATVRHLHRPQSAGDATSLALLAVGGYGRAEMSPHSDVDLLFLTPWKINAWAESVIESMLYILWDLRFKVGHASRTIDEALRLSREDLTIRTSLLEHRHLAGHSPLTEELHGRLRAELFHGTESEFIEGKLAERSARHRKQGGQRYVTEPNVKEGKGGLRDLQSLFWIGKYVHGVDRAAELVPLGVFTQDEYDQFHSAENFLWAVRNQLHLISGRAMEQLTFDLQVDVAERLGYADRGGRRAVEHFMQDYFRTATKVGELTRIFLAAMEATHVKRAPSLIGLFKRRKKLRPGFKRVQNRLTYEDPQTFLSEKLNLLRIFDEALRTGYLIHPDAMRLIAANLHLIDDALRRDKEAVRIFQALLLKRGNPERALRRMNELGVLAAFVPEFQPVVAMMQFNMYHHFTVDEHTIQCISTLAGIERGEMAESLPVASRLMAEGGVNRRVLYLALFLHDIGKGRAEDHSVLGARIARTVAPRLGLKPDECATVEWLVRYHLLMSDMAQKRDLSDPRTIRDFAKAVKTQKRLDLLALLTTCDIIGVGPGVWNNWKAQLLRNLYRQTSTALSTGLEELNREAREGEARSALRTALADWPSNDVAAELARHYGPYWQGLQTETQAAFARLLQGIGGSEIRLELTADEARDATLICFAMADHPGIFARLAGALALVGANVVDARSYTTKDGFVTAAFWVQDADGAPYDPARHDRVKATIGKILGGEVLARDAMASRDRIKKRERAFRHPTSIAFDNEGSEIFTIVEVDTRDRPGLLHDLSRTFAEANLYISSAQIATYGAQAVDTFYVKDLFGLKVTGRDKLAGLERKLTDAITRGADRAASE